MKWNAKWEIARLILKDLYTISAFGLACVGFYNGMHGDFLKAAYYMAFAAWMKD